jgi:hypothetical protein
MDRHPAGGPAAIAISRIAGGGGVKRPIAIAWIAGGVRAIAIAIAIRPIAISRIAVAAAVAGGPP